jgi:DNA-binding transcriptional LysR family regulator
MNCSETDFLVRHASLRQSQILVTVVHTGGYTRAAETLHLTQPTVFMQVKKLSETVGLPLFERVGKRLHLTLVGRKVLDAAEDILERLGHLGDDMIELKGEVKGELRIAGVTTVKYFMPHLLGAFLQAYPEVKPLLTVTNRARVIGRLTDNEDELIIMGQVPDHLEVEAYPFLENKLIVVASPNHRLARKPSISLARLTEERFLVREAGSGTRLAMDHLLAEHGLTINPYMELGSSEAIKQAVMAGLGLSVLSINNLRLELAGGHVAVLDVEGFPLERYWYAVHLKNKKLSLVTRTFLDFLLKQGKDVLQHNIAVGQPGTGQVRST